MSKNTKKISSSSRVSRQPRQAEDYVQGILNGDRILLSQAITLVESARPEHQKLAQDILERCLRASSKHDHPDSVRIGVTGSPGVGKSSFIETFGTWLTGLNRKVAVLAIDPTSQLSKGSILGDKTRMSLLAANQNAFIRPSPSGESLGGVAARTRETMLLCEAAGFDTIIVETVGVGQSEVGVHDMADFFLLLLQPGAGDELQGIKRGIVEMADLLAINKTDGGLAEAAHHARREYSRALHLFPAKQNGWTPKAVTCSALMKDGMEEIWKTILDFQALTRQNGWFAANRKEQLKRWLYEHIERELILQFYQNELVRANLERIETEIMEGKTPSARGAEELMRLFKK